MHLFSTRCDRCDALTVRIAARGWPVQDVAVLMLVHLMLFLLSACFGLLVGKAYAVAVRLGFAYFLYLGVPGVVHVLLRRRGTGWADAFGLGRGGLRPLLLSIPLYLALLPLVMAVAYAWQRLLYATGREPGLQEAALAILTAKPWLRALYIVTAVLAVPAYEEVLFRGILYPTLTRTLGTAGSIGLVSAFFAFLHFHLPSFAPLVLLSAVLCLAYRRTGSLWICIGTHAVFNAISILQLFLME